MTPKEAYKILKNTFITTRGNHDAYSKALHLAMASLQKQIPQKVLPDEKDWGICPNSNCSGSVQLDIEQVYNDEIFYCEHCGQALYVRGIDNGKENQQ